MAQPYTQNKAKKRPFKAKKPFFKQKQVEKKGTGVYVDFDEVPRDLTPDEIEALIEELPKSRKKKTATHEFVEVQGMNLGEMHEVAEQEAVRLVLGELSAAIGAERLLAVLRERVLHPEDHVLYGGGAWGGRSPPLLGVNDVTAARRVGSVLSHLSVP